MVHVQGMPKLKEPLTFIIVYVALCLLAVSIQSQSLCWYFIGS